MPYVPKEDHHAMLETILFNISGNRSRLSKSTPCASRASFSFKFIALVSVSGGKRTKSLRFWLSSVSLASKMKLPYSRETTS